MKKAVPAFLFAVLFMGLGFQVRSVDAYNTYSTNGSSGNCATCHGDFNTGGTYTSLTDGQSWGDNLHDVHRNDMLNGDCDTCHGSGGRSPVILDSSVGGSGLSPLSCVGCHGRLEDAGNDSLSGGLGAGLRQHHTTAGVDTCVSCHSDADPTNYNSVGENVLPPYYANPGTEHPNMPTNPCNQGGNENFAGGPDGLDNDGDLLYDGTDSDCGAAGTPDIAVSPTSIDFGDVTVLTTSSPVEVTISNTGTADLELFDGVLSDSTNFILDLNGGTNPCGDAPPPIAPGGNCTVSVAFSPRSVGLFNAMITVTSNDPDEGTLDFPLTGNGVAEAIQNISVTPASVNFGLVDVGATPAIEVTISNTGSADLAVSGIALDNTAVYSLNETGGTNPCGTLTPTIAPNDNCTLDVIFAPDVDGGPFTATVTIDSNDPDTPTVDVPVTGTGFLDSDGDGVGDSADDFPADASKATPEAATGTGKITVDAGTDTLNNVAAVAVAPGQTVPSGYTFPDGLVTFRVAVAAPGDNAVVTLAFPSGQPSGGKYFKDDGSGALVEFEGAMINTDNVVLMLTDGGSGDNDNTADTMINDPGGLATPVPSPSGGGGGGGCSVNGSGGGGNGTAVIIFITLLAVLVALRRQGARARR